MTTKPKSLQELREERDQIKTEMRAIKTSYEQRKAEGKRGDECWGGKDERQKFAGLDERRKALDAEIQDITDEQRFAELDAETRSDPEPPRHVNGINHQREAFEQRREDTRLALRAWSTYGSADFAIDRRTSEACQRLGFSPADGNLRLEFRDSYAYDQLRREFRAGRADELIEKRALSALNPTAGGYTIGSTLVDRIEANMLFFGEVEQISDLMLTDTGEPMSWSTMDDTSNDGEMLGENRETASDEEPTFGLVRWNAYEFSSKLVKVPRSALTDQPNLESMLGRALGMRIARAFNAKCTTGTGNSQPRGYLRAAGLGKGTASATAVTRDEILDLIHSVDIAYRNNGCRLVMHDLILSELRQLKDSQNRPLDIVRIDGGVTRLAPDLGGYPININNAMDSALATTNKTMAFGDFTMGKIRRVRGIVVQRLVERLAEYNQIGFLTIVRQDYNVLDAGTDPIKFMQQA